MNHYPENYFGHFIAMYAANFGLIPNAINIAELMAMYKKIEGEDSFQALVKEVKDIKINDDWALFIGLSKDEFKLIDDIKVIATGILEAN